VACGVVCAVVLGDLVLGRFDVAHVCLQIGGFVPDGT
jgi:hypothetical protein